jgi:hypothetical protein
MNVYSFSGVAIASADVMPWTSHVAGSVASAAHPAIATHDAIPATKRRNAAAPVASVNRGSV